MDDNTEWFYVITRIGEFFIVIAVSFVLVIIAQSFIIREVDVGAVEARLLAYNMLASDAVQRHDTLPVSLDPSSLGEQQIATGLPVKDYLGAHAAILTTTASYDAYYNRRFYDAWLAQAAARGTSCVLRDQADLPALINGKLAHAKIEVVAEREVATCS